MKRYLQLDLLILAMRLLLAFTLWNYGYSKLTDGQFGLTEAEQDLAIKDLSLFKISWYIFDAEPFKSFVGWSQVVAAILLIFKRTFLLGTLMAIPIFLNILIIDITIMPLSFKIAFIFRISFYLFFLGIILLYHKTQVIDALKSLTAAPYLKFKHHKKWFLIIPFYMVLLEMSSAVPKLIFYFIFHFDETKRFINHYF